MGLTVLAMGNSLGDMAADLAVARSGSPNMAVTACYAGPVFNILIGLGAGFLMRLQRIDADTAPDPSPEPRAPSLEPRVLSPEPQILALSF